MVKYQFFIRILEFSLTIGCLLVGFNWGITGVAIAVLFANISIIFIKLYVITNKVGSSIPKVILRIISAWRFTLVLGPAMLVMRIVLPNTFVGDIINLIIYGILVFMLFILAPSIIGETYKEGAYKSITSRIKQKIGRK